MKYPYIVLFFTESCFMKVSNEACLSASKPDMECHWCSTANLCSNGRDTHSKAWMINNCSKNISNCWTEQISLFPISFYIVNLFYYFDCLLVCLFQNMQMDKKSEQMDKKSDQKDNKPMFNYLYVLIPSVIGLVIVCVGFIVWFWLSKRQ